MTTSDKTPKQSPEPAESITEFEVGDGGILHMANFAEAGTRADFYEGVSDFWSRSPQHLADAMDQCEPLAWAVHSLYSRYRDEVASELEYAVETGADHEDRTAVLEAALAKLPEEPYDGAADWLLSLTTAEFEERVVPVIDKWFAEPPDWSFEDDYLPVVGTAQGAALDFFRDMAADALEILGVAVIESEHPGSTYYAAELRGDVDEANRAAEAAGVPVRFVAATD